MGREFPGQLNSPTGLEEFSKLSGPEYDSNQSSSGSGTSAMDQIALLESGMIPDLENFLALFDQKWDDPSFQESTSLGLEVE